MGNDISNNNAKATEIFNFSVDAFKNISQNNGAGGFFGDVGQQDGGGWVNDTFKSSTELFLDNYGQKSETSWVITDKRQDTFKSPGDTQFFINGVDNKTVMYLAGGGIVLLLIYSQLKSKK